MSTHTCTPTTLVMEPDLTTTLTTAIAPLSSSGSEVTTLDLSLSPGVLPTSSSSLAIADLPDLIRELDTAAGTLSLSSGILTADLTTPLGAIQQTIDIVEIGNTLTTALQGITGSLTVTNGLASGNLVIGDEEFIATDLDVAGLISGFVTDWLSSFSGSFSFSNGEIAIATPTPLGDITGTIGFGTGALTVDIDTPFAPINFSIDFPADAQYAFPIPTLNSSAIVNLDTGVLDIDLSSFFPGANITLPLTLLSGEVGFSGGLANLSVDTPLGNVIVPIDLMTEVSEAIADFFTAASGVFTIGAGGNFGADLQTPLGSFAGVLPVGDWLTTNLATLAASTGTIAIANGVATLDLVTPTGTEQGTIAFGSVLDELADLLELAIA